MPAHTFDSAPIAMPESPVLSINDKSRRLRCLIESESVVFTVPTDLKKSIKEERKLDILKDIDHHTLEL
jgi:inorganic pyrophosphatase/exopolyphosphatase